MDYFSRPYPNRIKVIRQNAGFSQQQVARLLGHKSSAMLHQQFPDILDRCSKLYEFE